MIADKEKLDGQAVGEETMDHAYMHEHGIPHEHVHSHEFTHPHVHEQLEADHAKAAALHSHTHPNTKAVVNRLARAIGHLERVKAMVEEGRDCSEVLIQLAAVRSAINNAGKVVLKDHLEHCIVEAVENQDRETIEELNKAIEQFVK